MRDTKVATILRIHNGMKNEISRGNWTNRWDEAYHYILPDKDSVFDWNFSANRGSNKWGDLYDSSAVHYNELLASALHSMLTNPSSNWFDLLTSRAEINNSPRVRAALQETVRRAHNILNNSNFHSEIHEVYLDFGAPGISVLLMEEDDKDVIRFRAEPIYKYYLKENFKSEIDTISTEMVMTVRQAFQKYGEDAFGDKYNELKGDLDQEITIIHLLMPREDAKREKIAPKFKPIASYHIWEKGGILLLESGFDEWPVATPRWMKVSGETYARSPGMKSMPDIKMVNAMMKTTIRAAQKRTDPPLMVPDDGVIGKVNTTPGGLNSYRAGSQDRIFPLETGGDVGLGLEMVRETRERVKQNFFIDQLQLREGPQMTATEVNQRIEEQLRLLGPILGRLNNELLKPLIARLIGIMRRKKLLPEMPPELAAENVEVYFSSQIARAQRMAEVSSLNNYLASLGGYAQFDPSVVKLVDPKKYARHLANLQGVPEIIFRSEEELKTMEKQEAAMQQQLMQQQSQLAEAETANKAAPLINNRGF